MTLAFDRYTDVTSPPTSPVVHRRAKRPNYAALDAGLVGAEDDEPDEQEKGGTAQEEAPDGKGLQGRSTSRYSVVGGQCLPLRGK